jgi:hypothetical protein
MRLIPFFSAKPLSAALAAALGLAIPALSNSGGIQPSVSAVMVVTNCADAGPGSLRDVIGQADTGSTIDLSQLPCVDSTITLTSGSIPIGGDRVLTISGVPVLKTWQAPARAVGPMPIIDGSHNSRIFDHATGSGDFTLRGVALRNGYAMGPGGCLRSNGDVMMYGTVITGCTAHAVNYSGQGGGVFVAGNLKLENSRVSGNACTGTALFSGGGVYANSLDMSASTVSDNTAVGFGGGLSVNGTASISYSTISGNHAAYDGGAVLGFNGVVSIVNTTISGNQSAGVAGLLVPGGPLSMASTTIAFNTSSSAAGIGGLAFAAPATLQSTLIANNLAAGAASDVGAGCVVACNPPVSGANNLIVSAHVPVPQGTLSGDPLLTPLANHGGSTLTHGLATNSPAIDHGDNLGDGHGMLTNDQRANGYPRVAGASADIGAFEYGSGPDRIFFNGFDRLEE